MELSQYLLTRGTSVDFEGGGTLWQPLTTNRFIIAAALAVADLPDDSEPVFNLYTLQISDTMAALVDARLSGGMTVVNETADVTAPDGVTTGEPIATDSDGKHAE